MKNSEFISLQLAVCFGSYLLETLSSRYPEKDTQDIKKMALGYLIDLYLSKDLDRDALRIVSQELGYEMKEPFFDDFESGKQKLA